MEELKLVRKGVSCRLRNFGRLKIDLRLRFQPVPGFFIDEHIDAGVRPPLERTRCACRIYVIRPTHGGIQSDVLALVNQKIAPYLRSIGCLRRQES